MKEGVGMTNIGDYIAKARIDKGYSMRKLARLSDYFLLLQIRNCH